MKADLAKSDWGISYDIIGSQDVSLVKHLEEQKIIDLVISEHKDKETYPNGMVQPGLLFIRRSDRAVLFKWAVRPVTWLRPGSHWECLVTSHFRYREKHFQWRRVITDPLFHTFLGLQRLPRTVMKTHMAPAVQMVGLPEVWWFPSSLNCNLAVISLMVWESYLSHPTSSHLS